MNTDTITGESRKASAISGKALGCPRESVWSSPGARLSSLTLVRMGPSMRSSSAAVSLAELRASASARSAISPALRS
ncbi:hypothetical protein D9M69_653070 [compost metagenome]